MAQAKKTTAKGKKGKNDVALAAGIGAGVLAAGAAAAAGYYFYGAKDAKKHRAAAAKWAKDMKKEVEKEARALKKIDRKAIASIVDKAAAAYEGARGVNDVDLRGAAMELKKNWQELQKEILGAPAKKTAAKKAPAKAVKKAAPKKTAKKAAKK